MRSRSMVRRGALTAGARSSSLERCASRTTGVDIDRDEAGREFVRDKDKFVRDKDKEEDNHG